MYKNRLARYLNQSVGWQRRYGRDAYNKPQYFEPVAVAARVEGRARLVRDSMGSQVVSNTTVFCAAPIEPMDLVDGQTVISVARMVGPEGEDVGVEAYL